MQKSSVFQFIFNFLLIFCKGRKVPFASGIFPRPPDGKKILNECINILTFGNKKPVMKKLLIGLIVVFVLISTVVLVLNYAPNAQAETDYLRIHVRANSNDEIDQSVKYIVKDEVVKFITPYAAQCTDKQRAVEIISSILPEIERVCDSVLKENGFSYTSRASVRAEEFPTRIYGDLTLESGIYDALIIELGTGKGDNWWCVIYPPPVLYFGHGGRRVPLGNS